MTALNDIGTLTTAEGGQRNGDNTLSDTQLSSQCPDGSPASDFPKEHGKINCNEVDLHGGSGYNSQPASPPHHFEKRSWREGSPKTLRQICGIENSTQATPIRSMFNTFIYLSIGREPHNRTFGIHKGLLCQNSKYFHAAFNGPFTEASSGQISLADENPTIFDIVYTWLYTGKLTYCKEGKDVQCLDAHYVNLYIFGDKYDMPRLCNEAVNGIIHRYERYNAIYNNPKHVYHHTPPASPLRRVMVAIYVKHPTSMMDVYDRFSDDMAACPEFLLDVIKALSLRYEKGFKPAKVGKAREIMDRCQFHRHGDGEMCS
ncbi:MAG: hypothetical protein Q9217_004665 [Psora testacea]